MLQESEELAKLHERLNLLLEEQQKEWLELNKIKRKLVLLSYGQEGILARHYALALKHIEQAQEHLKKQIEP